MTTYKPIQWPEYHPVTDTGKFARPQFREGRATIVGGYEYSILSTCISLTLAVLLNLGIIRMGLVSGHWSADEAGWAKVAFLVFGGLALKMAWDEFDKLRRGLQEMRLTPPRLTLPEGWLRAGQPLSVSFERQFKGEGGFPRNGELNARLVLLEVTRRKAGTDIVYDHTFLYEQHLPAKRVMPKQSRMSATWQIQLPHNAAPNFIGSNHWVVRQLHVLQDMPEVGQAFSEFVLPVGGR